MALSSVDQSPRLASQVLEAFASNGAHNAALVGGFLEAVGLIPPRSRRKRQPVCLPPAFLLELAGILRLAEWEHLGFQDKLGEDVPAPAQALADLFKRWSTKLGKQAAATSPELLHSVLDIWFRKFAWAALEELGADVILEATEEEELLEDLADFLWRHRGVCRKGES